MCFLCNLISLLKKKIANISYVLLQGNFIYLFLIDCRFQMFETKLLPGAK